MILEVIPVIGYPSELIGKALLQKILYALIIGLREIKLELD